jgi:hypothetical protein
MGNLPIIQLGKFVRHVSDLEKHPPFTKVRRGVGHTLFSVDLGSPLDINTRRI